MVNPRSPGKTLYTTSSESFSPHRSLTTPALPVNSSIGAPGALYRDRVVGNCGKRLLQPLLHGIYITLGLPTMERRTVIFHTHSNAH